MKIGQNVAAFHVAKEIKDDKTACLWCLKNDIFLIAEKTALHIIHRLSRASHGSVVSSLRTDTIYVATYKSGLSRSGNTLTHDQCTILGLRDNSSEDNAKSLAPVTSYAM